MVDHIGEKFDDGIEEVTFVEAKVPVKCQFLFKSSRYKVLYGGRGSGKSWGIALALLIKGINKKTEVLCVRELQKSLDQSSYKLLRNLIRALGFDDAGKFPNNHYIIQESKIFNNLGTCFSFEGIRGNTEKIKSYEGVDVCWVEEANKITESQWEILAPTIRKDGSEIWISFNPEEEEDFIYRHFIIEGDPEATVVKMNWRDNPWFNDVMMKMKDRKKETDFDGYLHIWEGHTRLSVDGAVYSKELRALRAEGRICEVPYDKRYPVDTYWDLGFADMTAIWFIQKVGMEIHVIDYYENRHEQVDHYLQVLQQKPYTYGVHFLPHDATAKNIRSAMTIEQQVRSKLKLVSIVPRIKVHHGIDALRALFPQMYFDHTKCAKGLKGLANYRYAISEGKKAYSQVPLHDDASHPADALRYFATAGGRGQKILEKSLLRERNILHESEDYFSKFENGPNSGGPLGWMS